VFQQPLVSQSLLIIEASRSHSDIVHSVGLLWKSDQPHAGTSTWKNTTPTREGHLYPWRGSNPQSQQRAAADPRLRLLGYWNRLSSSYPTPITHTPNYVINHSEYPGTEIWRCLFKSRKLKTGFEYTLLPTDVVTEGFWYG